MALVVNGGTVATAMSPTVEEALYADQIFIDGVTFTSKHEIGNAGQIQVLKYAADETVGVVNPGSDFTESDYSNNVIDINCNNGFHLSGKLPNFFAATVPAEKLVNKVKDVVAAIRNAREKTAIAVLVASGTVWSVTTAITAENIKSMVIDARKFLIKKKAHPTVCICSVDTYGAAQEFGGKDFTFMFNDDIARSGKIGYWMGVYFIEASLLDNLSSYAYKDASGVTQTVSIADVDFIMYDFNAFSIIDALTGLRVIDTEKSFSALVQGELACGFKVTNADCVLVKKN